jgi:uncharacterized protein YktA (UPF0223 family)
MKVSTSNRPGKRQRQGNQAAGKNSETNQLPKKMKRRSSMLKKLGTGIHKIEKAVEKFTHEIIDPYCTVKLSTTDETQTTKPVRDGGQNTCWTSNHNNVLRFKYSFDEVDTSEDFSFQVGGSELDSERQQMLDDNKGTLYFDVFDQDMILDAHIGGNHVDLCTILNQMLADNSLEIDKSNTIIEQPLEIPLYRKLDGAISGFLRARIRFEYEGTGVSYNDEGLPLNNVIQGDLVITIESGSDLWDPNSDEDWIPTDATQGRSVFLSFCICFVYFIGGSYVFHLVEGWGFWDAMYYGAATFTTVGYGSPAPLTDGGRLAASFYMIFGVTMVSVSIIRLWLALLSSVSPTCLHCSRMFVEESTLICPSFCCRLKKRELAAAAAKTSNIEDRPEFKAKRNSMHGGWQSSNVSKVCNDLEDGTENEEKELVLEEHVEEKPTTLLYVSIIAGLKLICLVLFGTIFYMAFPGENLSFINAIYMSTATVMTVGYGDVSPQTEGGKIVATWWMIIGYAVLLRALQDVANKVHEKSLHKMRTQLLNRDLSRTAILNMDKDGDGLLSRLEFITHMIVALKLCTPEHLRAIMQRFDEVEQSREARVRVLKVMESYREYKRNSKGNLLRVNSTRDTVNNVMESRKVTHQLMQETVYAALPMPHLPNSPNHQKRKASNSFAVDAGHLVRSGTTRMLKTDLEVINQTTGKRRSIVRNKTLRQSRGVEVGREGREGREGRVEADPGDCGQETALKKNAGSTKIVPVFVPRNNSETKETKERTEKKETKEELSHENILQRQDLQLPVSPATSSIGDDISPEHRDNALSTMLAHMRRARDASRRYVEEQTTAGNNGDIEHTRSAIQAYRDLLEALHRQQKFACDLLESDDPELLILRGS